jgi:Transposase IS116/IS110/IS902 family
VRGRPVPASSGKITRHGFSRGGDRAANSVLYRVALVGMSAHPQTRDYVQRQDANGRTKKELLRLLKRAIAREVFRLLTRPAPIDGLSDRLSKGRLRLHDVMASPPFDTPDRQRGIAGSEKARCRCFHRQLTKVLTTTMTTFRLPDTSTYTTQELVSCLVV